MLKKKFLMQLLISLNTKAGVAGVQDLARVIAKLWIISAVPDGNLYEDTLKATNCPMCTYSYSVLPHRETKVLRTYSMHEPKNVR